MTMTSPTHSAAFVKEPSTPSLDEVAMPILIGAAIGLGTGALIWMMIVVHFGLIRLFWP